MGALEKREAALKGLQRQIRLSRLRREVLCVVGSAEKRRHYRIRADQALRFRSRLCKRSTNAQLGNLSNGGLFVRTDNSVPPGTVVAGVFPTDDGIIGFRGTVVWATGQADGNDKLGAGFGVRFTHVGIHPLT